jgi:hypothetical protein
LDFAYYKNGWVYHTAQDTEDIIPVGSIQRSGANMLAVVDAALKAKGMQSSTTDSRHVYFDVVGIFAVSYKAFVGGFLRIFWLKKDKNCRFRRM